MTAEKGEVSTNNPLGTKEKLLDEVGVVVDDIKEQVQGVTSHINEEDFDAIIKEIESHSNGMKISEMKLLGVNQKGEKYGIVKIGSISYPFVGTAIITQIGNEPIRFPEDIHFRPDGLLSGRVLVEGESQYYPFIGDKIIKQIGGFYGLNEKDIVDVDYIRTLGTGKMVGGVKVGYEWFPFIDNRVIERIRGQKIERISKPYFSDEGKDYIWYLEVNGEFLNVPEKELFGLEN